MTDMVNVMSQLPDHILERYMKAEDRLTQKRRPALKWIALAACLCLIVGAMHYPSDSPLPQAPPLPPIPEYENALFTADQIASLFPKTYDSVTNAYTTVTAPRSGYLPLQAIPDAQELPIYDYHQTDLELDPDAFGQLLTQVTSDLRDVTGIDLTGYSIQYNTHYDDLEVSTAGGGMELSATQSHDRNYINLSNQYSDTVFLNGQPIRLDPTATDQGIALALADIQAQLLDIFGVDFPDMKVSRHYQTYDASAPTSITVYFYDRDAHPLNEMMSVPVSDYIELYFYNISEDVTPLSCNRIRYQQYREAATTRYPVTTDAQMISLEEAEALLYNGCVFGDPVCPLCMAFQKKVDFYGYDFVGFTYITGANDDTSVVPFYTFYKKLYTGSNGNIVYAKTNVPAIQVSGLTEYFQSQHDRHT